MTQLGKAVSILMAHQRLGDAYYDDLHAFHAPSECYADVNKGLMRSFRPVRKHACRVAGVKNLKQLRRAVKKACPTWDRYNHFRLGVQAI
jgi:hypothetical protein